MSIIRIIARPLLATGFVVNGVDAFRNSSRSAEHLAPVLTGVERAVPKAKSAVSNSAVVAQGLAAAQVTAGVAYGLGKFPRTAASVLVVTTSLNAYLDFQAAEHGSKEQKAARRNSGLKNVSLIGATMLATVDTNGRPSLAWRAKHFVDSATKSSSSFAADASKRLEQAQKSAEKSTRGSRKAAKKAAEQAQKRAAERIKQAQKAAKKAQKKR